MKNIKIITDSASDITDNSRDDLIVLPMTITFGDTEYKDGVNLTHREFFEKLVETDELPTTSQISPYEFEEVYKQLSDDEEAVVITMSSKLSGTYQSACIAASEYPNVHVVDSENVTVGEHALVEYALRLKDGESDVLQIVESLEKHKKDIRLVALVDTLEYLQKGGRISKVTALVGGILSIKPVIAITDGEVAILGKARGSKQGNNLLVQQINECGGIDFTMPYYLAYSGLDDALIKKYIEDSRGLWQDGVEKLDVSLIGGTIRTHVGPGAIAVAFFAKH